MTLGGAVLSGWRMAGLALDSGAALTSLARAGAGRGGDYRQRIRSAAGGTGAGAVILSLVLPSTEARVSGGRMTIWHGTFTLGNTLAPLDTFLALPGWHKGAAWVNGAHLGRYWPAVGPQLTLYVPAQLLRPPPEVNTLVLLEQVRTSVVQWRCCDQCSCVQDHCPCISSSATAKTTCHVELVPEHQIDGDTPLS